MTEEQIPREDEAPRTPDDAGQAIKSQWDAIVRDFQALGQSIADTVKEAWQDEANRQQLQELGDNLKRVADQIISTVDEALQSPAVSEVKNEFKKAPETVKEAGQRVYTETQPLLLNALKTLDEGLQNLINRLEKTSPSPPPPSESAPPPSADEEA